MDDVAKEHLDKFGVEVKLLGLYRYDKNKLYDNIVKAIEENKPYNEYNLLTKEEQIAFNSGKLLF